MGTGYRAVAFALMVRMILGNGTCFEVRGWGSGEAGVFRVLLVFYHHHPSRLLCRTEHFPSFVAPVFWYHSTAATC